MSISLSGRPELPFRTNKDEAMGKSVFEDSNNLEPESPTSPGTMLMVKTRQRRLSRYSPETTN